MSEFETGAAPGAVPENGVLTKIRREILMFLKTYEDDDLAARPFISEMAAGAILDLMVGADRTDRERIQSIETLRYQRDFFQRMSSACDTAISQLLDDTPSKPGH